MSIKMKKSDLVIAYAVIAVILAGVLAGLAACQMDIPYGLDISTPSTGVDTGPVWMGGDGSGPRPSIAIYWDDDENTDQRGKTIQWSTTGTVRKTAKAVLKNPPAGYEYLQWTFGTDSVYMSEAEYMVFVDDTWEVSAQPGLSEMTIEAGEAEDTATITVWNCDSTGNRGRVSSSFILDVVKVGTP